MNLSPLLKKIFFVLFTLNILLVALNIILPRLVKGHGKNETEELSSNEINYRFVKALHSYNLSDQWIKKGKGDDSLLSYKIDVPKDLPISLLIREISGAYDTNEAVVTSKELKLRSTTEVNISSANHKKLNAVFDYNDKINRRTADIGFIISAPDLNEETKNRLIMIPEKFLLMIIPSKESAAFVQKLRRAGKEYAVLLNDDTKDLDYKLNPSYSMERLKISVRSLLDSFRDAVCYVYDPSSGLYGSSAFEYTKQELEKRKIKLVDYKSLPEVSGGNYTDKFKDLVENMKQGDRRLILISADDYFNALPEITAFWKKGYKFINPSLMIQQ